MFEFNRAALGLALALVAAQAARAAPRIEVVQVWSRPAVAGGAAVGFMTLRNRGARPDALVGVSSPRSGSVMIHRTAMAGGVASMQMLDRAELPAGGSLVFAPGGYHLMFTGLKTGLNVGDRLPATLAFSSGLKLDVSFIVTLAPPSPKN